MAANQRNGSNEVNPPAAETSMTGQELLQQIATIVGPDNLKAMENIASSPIDISPNKNSLTANSGEKTVRARPAGAETVTNTDKSSSLSPPIVYGELSILGYNGGIPNSERNGRRNKSKFLLCKRAAPNGIRKSEHYIVKQPQATKAIQDKDNYSISYTFSRSQTIIVEYKQDDKTDLFQIGRSSEDPIDFVVMDTIPSGNLKDSSSRHNHKRHPSSNRHSSAVVHNSSQHYSENPSSSQHFQQPFDLVEMTRFNRHLTKLEEEMLHRGITPYQFDSRGRLPQVNFGHISGQSQAAPINYPSPNLSNIPPFMAEHLRRQNPSLFNFPYNPLASGSHHHHLQQQPFYMSPLGPSVFASGDGSVSHDNRYNINNQHQRDNVGSHNHSSSKRSHAVQSTISRFACRIIVEREPPYTARIFAAGFDSSKNIFLGEKATIWEQNNSIDGLTTNGILIMHPKKGYFCDTPLQDSSENDKISAEQHETKVKKKSTDDKMSFDINENSQKPYIENKRMVSPEVQGCRDVTSNLGNPPLNDEFDRDGAWREVSVDGGIYAIRESRSAIQKGKRIENETNILRDGTLIDLCGATLLWRSVDGFMSSPTKRTLEEKIDTLNASRPQCPVGLNTLVIPRKPVLQGSERHDRRNSNTTYKDYHHSKTKNQHAHHSPQSSKSSEKSGSGQQPYVYLKCGHVQGYHDWGVTDKSDHRTCPVCLSVGTVAKLSMGLEPSFYVDSGPLTHVFNPCGHMASERTIKYWTSIKIPHGTHFFHSICPFCATPLASDEPSSIRLIFQEDSD